jgi:membrane protease YdiL (CAAX protease family)
VNEDDQARQRDEESTAQPSAGTRHDGDPGLSNADAEPVYAAGAARGIRRIDIPPVAFGLIMLVVTFFSYQVLGGLITYLLYGINLSGEVQGMRVVTILSQLAFLLAPPLIMLRVQPWDIRRVLRLRAPRLAPALLVVVSVMAMQFVLQGYLVTQQFVLKEYLLPESLIKLLESLEDLIEGLYRQLLIMRSPAEMLFVLLVAAVTPAVCEEVLFRGAVLGSLERGMRTRWAVVLTGVIFSLFHLNPVTFVPLALLGMYIGFVVVRGGSLWLGVIAHAANNTIAVISLYFMESESLVPEQTATGAPSPEILLSAAVGLGIVVLGTLLFLRATSSDNDTTQA